MSFAQPHLKPPGQLDPSFGAGDGIDPVSIPGPENAISLIQGLAVDTEARVLFATSRSNRFVLGRRLRDGGADRQFGIEGLIHDFFTTEEGGNSTGTGVFILESGAIMLRGSHSSGSRSLPALALFDGNGHYDFGFGQYGKSVIPLPDESPGSDDLKGELLIDGDPSTPLLISADEKILMVYEGFLIRLLKNGQPDPSFNGGKHYVDTRHPEYPSVILRMVQVCEDKLVLSGNANVNGERVVMFTCFFLDGKLDTDYGQNGYVLLNELGINGQMAVTALVTTSPGKVVAIGQRQSPTREQGFLIGLDSVGKLDRDFNDGDPVFTPVTDSHRFYWNAGAIDSKGRIIVSGGSMEGSGSPAYIVVGRYLPDGKADLDFSENEGFVTTTNVQLSVAVAPDPYDRIVIGGLTIPPNSPLLLRYLA
ncbi:hypothetical protein [Pseudomonas umsongensis]|jgi:uncharacterized delta-60 repeat protein|uniref:hypothetical protein n=1 Tax=Pseudomonas umsongensis TaxID=198618 RepID=UPI0015BA75E8|nr:hypothetical protein [Pseudomonas umsongensis]